MLGDQPSDDDPLIGLLDSADLAREAVDAHNRRLAVTSNRAALRRAALRTEGLGLVARDGSARPMTT